MEASSFLNGNKVIWNDEEKVWQYPSGQNTHRPKRCPKCDKLPDKNGHDKCLGTLPGVAFACCGHGVEDGYIKFTNGVIVRFELKSVECE
jgi:hypothetical protein